MRVLIPHPEGVALLGPLPQGIAVLVAPAPTAQEIADERVEFWVPPFLSDSPVSDGLRSAEALAVVQLMTAGVDAWLGKLPESVKLCNARGVHTAATAEWAMTAILAYLREFPGFALAQARQEWSYHRTDELSGKRVLIIGAGDIGAAIAARLLPFDAQPVLVGRHARPGCFALTDLAELLPAAEIVVLAVPLTAQTQGMVDARFLARMAEGALLVNAARGQVVLTDALVAELATGRLGFATDVTDPEPLPAGHPLWSLPNVLITPHIAGTVTGALRRVYALVGDQLRRYAAGEPLQNIVTGDY